MIVILLFLIAGIFVLTLEFTKYIIGYIISRTISETIKRSHEFGNGVREIGVIESNQKPVEIQARRVR